MKRLTFFKIKRYLHLFDAVINRDHHSCFFCFRNDPLGVIFKVFWSYSQIAWFLSEPSRLSEVIILPKSAFIVNYFFNLFWLFFSFLFSDFLKNFLPSFEGRGYTTTFYFKVKKFLTIKDLKKTHFW